MILREKTQKNRVAIAMLMIILIVGIFLRTWHFSQWLRFNDDQARDARLAKYFLTNNTWPLLGPRAAQTDFKLGPIYYYFQHVAALIFGASPVAIALPDLIFSILAIPMMFLLARKYFSSQIYFLLTALFSVSFFVVYYSRFAWNPNSVPFFALVFLYSLLRIMEDSQDDQKKNWIIFCGAALGIGVQLHTLFLITAPLVLIGAFLLQSKKRVFKFKTLALIILITLVFNVPQIYSEFSSKGKNIKSFFQSNGKESYKSKNFAQNLLEDTSCNFRENAQIISSMGGTYECSDPDLINPAARVLDKNMTVWQAIFWVLGALLIMVFSIGGYFLLIYFFKKEKNQERKNFLLVIGIYAAISFAIMMPLAFGIPERFFLIQEFVPFVLLGLWLKYLKEKFSKKGEIILLALGFILLLLNFYSLNLMAQNFAGKIISNDLSPQEVTLSEVKFFASFISEHSKSDRINFLDESGELFGMSRSLAYYLGNDNIELQQLVSSKQMQSSYQIFVLTLKNQQPSMEGDHDELDKASFGRFTIHLLVSAR